MSLEVSSRLRAVAHPLRLQILSLLTGADLSASEVARELGTTQANASYHLRVLAAAGHLVDAGEEKIRGGVAKRYRHPWREGGVRDDDDHPRPHADNRLFLEALCHELVRRQAHAGGGPGYSADAEMWVTPEVWQRVLELCFQAGTLIHAEAKPPRTEGTMHVNLTAVAFTMQGSGTPEGPSDR
ncbi:MAG: winged helix-turn-helix transcriptional regulator [Nocardioidaceae bacterium]|nr:winged helix-turn-helix transcriptional regulator [Nocardioidaceae bacterium]